jgi:hypothetical protein
MNTPFQYGKLATKENFVDRVEDRAQLKSFLSSHINVMLISPRRWGKSSLVKVAMVLPRVLKMKEYNDTRYE